MCIRDSVDSSQLWRWRTAGNFSEISAGVNWQSILSYSKALDSQRANIFYLRAFGSTRPNYLTQGYGPGMAHRRTFWKRWLFWELEPQYTWRRSDVSDEREGIASVALRLQVVFGEDYLH